MATTRSKKKFSAPRNFVAKHASKVCRAAVHKDKKKDYERTPRNRPAKLDIDLI